MTGVTAAGVRQQIQEIVERIVASAAPDRIILFGSHARGGAVPGSDVDLLVVMPVSGSRRRQATAIERSLIGVDLPVDLLVVTPEEVARDRDLPGTVIKPALDEGEILYERRR